MLQCPDLVNSVPVLETYPYNFCFLTILDSLVSWRPMFHYTKHTFITSTDLFKHIIVSLLHQLQNALQNALLKLKMSTSSWLLNIWNVVPQYLEDQFSCNLNFLQVRDCFSTIAQQYQVWLAHLNDWANCLQRKILLSIFFFKCLKKLLKARFSIYFVLKHFADYAYSSRYRVIFTFSRKPIPISFCLIKLK